jgi:ABC-2 type transport system ATP-binding protein
MIEIKNLTMQYPNGRGVFDVNLSIPRGSILGFLGPNGSGKTTTIRALLGFMNGSSGECTINGLPCFVNSALNCRDIGFIAGEPTFPDGLTGAEYLNLLISVRSGLDAVKSSTVMRMRKDELVAYFELDTATKIKRMSKGMKQKTAIVAAFMHDPSVLILDEPSSGLDPLMQNKFVELVNAERKKGKTILLSSHIFEEIEKTCEDIVIIKAGRIVARDSVKTLKKGQRKIYVLESPEANKIKLPFETKPLDGNEIEVAVPFDKIDDFVKAISKYTITAMGTKELSLEDVFLSYYSKEGKKEVAK